MKELTPLLTKRFSVYEGGGFFSFCDFLHILKLLATYSDFFSYTPKEQRQAIKKWLKKKYIYIDANICVKFN